VKIFWSRRGKTVFTFTQARSLQLIRGRIGGRGGRSSDADGELIGKERGFSPFSL